MIKTLTLTVPDDIAKMLVDCEPGDEKTLTFTVDKVDNKAVTGMVDHVEGYGDEGDGEDGDMEYPEPMREKHGGKKLPKAVLMIGLGK